MVYFSLVLINFHSLFCFIIFSNFICISTFSPTVEFYKKADLVYIIFSDRVGWIEARSICQTYEAELAIPNTTSKAEALAYFIKMSNSQYDQFWIGAYYKNTQWIWSDEQAIENINFTAINNNILNSENKCLVLKKQFYFKPLFAERMCFFPKPFICERSIFADVRHPLPTLPVQSTKINSSVFTIYHSKVGWNEAVAFCRSLDQRLAIVSDNVTLYGLTRALLQSRPYIENAWIGGYYYNSNWIWLANGNKISLKAGLPWNIKFTEACLLFGRHLNQPYLVPSRCEKKKSLICEKFDETLDVIKPDTSKITCNKGQHETIIYLTNKTWIDAQNFCRSKNSILAEPEDMKAMEELTTCLADQYLDPKHFWLGAIKERTNWMWASSYKSMNSSFNLCSDVFEPYEECLNLDKSNNNKPLLYGIQCKRKQAFICYRNTIKRTKYTCRCPCKQYSVSIFYNSRTYLALLFAIVYKNADYYCKHFGGKLIDSTLPQHTKTYILSNIERMLASCCCPLNYINLWVKNESKTSCTTLNLKSHEIDNTVECTTKNAFICQIDCGIPTNILTNMNSSTKCELIKKETGYSYNSCTFHCQDGYILFGPNKFICDSYGWSIRSSGNKEESFLYPECIKIKHAAGGFIQILKTLNYKGYYFIIKEQPNWEKIKHFIINFIGIFGASKDFPMGLMTFGNSVDVRIPYNGRDVCQVISEINKANVRSNENNTANYKLAFNEMQGQIYKYQRRKTTLIIFIVDSKNTGESYTEVLHKLKGNNIIYVIGITKNIVKDFDIVASIQPNHRLHSMKFHNYNDFYNLSLDLQNHEDCKYYC